MHELTCFHIFKDVILSYMQLMNRANLPSGLSMINVNDPCKYLLKWWIFCNVLENKKNCIFIAVEYH